MIDASPIVATVSTWETGRRTTAPHSLLLLARPTIGTRPSIRSTTSFPAKLASSSPPRSRSQGAATASAACGRSSARRSSPPSPTSTRATSRRTSPAARKFGYLLLWVIARREPDGDARAVPVGEARASPRGENLPEVCREHFPRRVNIGLWVQAEVIAMATDLAEFVGAAIGLNLLFGIPLFPAGAAHRRRRLRRSSRCRRAASGASRPSSPGLLGVIVARVRLQVVLAEPDPRRRSQAASCPASTAPRACCSRSGSSARR